MEISKGKELQKAIVRNLLEKKKTLNFFWDEGLNQSLVKRGSCVFMSIEEEENESLGETQDRSVFFIYLFIFFFLIFRKYY